MDFYIYIEQKHCCWSFQASFKMFKLRIWRFWITNYCTL